MLTAILWTLILTRIFSSGLKEVRTIMEHNSWIIEVVGLVTTGVLLTLYLN